MVLNLLALSYGAFCRSIRAPELDDIGVIGDVRVIIRRSFCATTLFGIFSGYYLPVVHFRCLVARVFSMPAIARYLHRAQYVMHANVAPSSVDHRGGRATPPRSSVK